MSGARFALKPKHGEGVVTGGAGFLVVLDVDSTLIEDEVIELVADYAGVRDRVADVTERAMRGELDFEGSLRERVALLAGVSLEEVAEVRRRIRVTAGVPEMIEAVHAGGGRVGAVSGGFHEILDPLAADLGLDLWRANRFESDAAGRLTGRVSGPIIGREAKAHTLRSWAQSLDVPMERTVAVGDGANDLGMMAIAGLSVAFDAKPVVRERASVVLRDRDMTALLPLLGLRG
ncbi:phosphoserine phosphatase SerB [Gulosibacter sp. 10]|uniref:phosphoserine phosphatase SerB n=1 Tax=Gulosibacter sp. 10 TaxID=1255570 RepID=UPI00097E9C79|nr:phosphoserine phosphatase SerB [Gulosibacter sp. 10]SJM53086.1 Phosphoserine phosphatase [Gulosibacter sp. 10]